MQRSDGDRSALTLPVSRDGSPVIAPRFWNRGLMSIYEDVLRAGGSVRNHGPDLRIEITDANDRILRKYPVQDAMKEICLIPGTGKLCWHIPYAFDPLVARPNPGL